MYKLINAIKFSVLIIALMLSISACERTLSDDAILPSFTNTAEIFTDNFVGMGTNFYLPFADAKPDVFSVDNTEGYKSNASIRFDVPNVDDPGGNYAGAILRVDGPGRNLTQYRALTFYIKASQGVTLGSAGFGIDYEANKYQVSLNSISVGTQWKKVTIPIPDPSKLLNERGLFWFSAGTQGTNGAGYTIWIDELKFEELPTLRLVASEIFEGNTTSIKSFNGSTIKITGLNQVYNLENGQDVTLTSSPHYYNFISSDTAVAAVDEVGEVSINSSGSAEITATLAGEPSNGKLIIESLGDLPSSPSPTHSSSDVKSIFSDAFPAVITSNFTPGFGGSTTNTTILTTSNGEVVQYTTNNFTGIMFDAPIDGSDMTHLHIDAYVQEPGVSIGVQIRDIGANQVIETNIFNGFPEGDDKDYRTTLSGFQVGVWKSFEIPLGGDIANQKNNLGAIILTDGPNFILDNIYFHK